MKDQWDCALNDLEELGDNEFLVLMDQYNIEIFSCFLHLLPLYSSTFHETNVENTQNGSEDNPLISWIQSLRLLEVDDNDEEYSVVWHWVSDRRISFWLNISPRSFTDRYSFCTWASRSTPSWFCFSLWSARKSKYIRLQRKFFDLNLRGFLLVVVVFLVAQVRDQLIQAMRISDHRVRVVLVNRFNSTFHSIFTLQVTGCNFQYGSYFGVPSNPTFRVRLFFISWWSVLPTCHWFCKLWEFFSVLCHEVLSDSKLLSGILHQYKS